MQISYILPVLWITSCFHIIDQMKSLKSKKRFVDGRTDVRTDRRTFCRRVDLNTTRPNFSKFSVHVTCGRGSVLLWQQCNMQCIYKCISGFVDDVTLSHNGTNMGQTQRGHYLSLSSPGGGTRDEVAAYDGRLVLNISIYKPARAHYSHQVHTVQVHRFQVYNSNMN